MDLSGKYLISFTKNAQVEEREGPGSVVEHEMELKMVSAGVISGSLGSHGSSRPFTGTLVDNRFEFTVQGGHPRGNPPPGAPADGPLSPVGGSGPPKDAKPFYMTYAGTIAEDGTIAGTMTCTGRYDEPTVDPLTGKRL